MLQDPRTSNDAHFILDVANIARIDWKSEELGGSLRANQRLSRIEYVVGVVEELKRQVERVLGGFSCTVNGIADNSLRSDFEAQNKAREFDLMMRTFGFTETAHRRQKADPLILEGARTSGAFVVSRDGFRDEAFVRHHSWLDRGGRLLQPSLTASRSVWMFTEYRNDAVIPRLLPEVLADFHPTVESIAAALGANTETVRRIMDSADFPVPEGPLARADARRVKDAGLLAVRYPTSLRHLRQDVSRNEVISILEENQVGYHSLPNDVLIDEGGMSLIHLMPSSSNVLSTVDAILDNRDATALRVLRGRIDELNDQVADGLTNLIGAIEQSGRIHWESLRSWDKRSLEWAVDASLFATNTAVLASLPLRLHTGLSHAQRGDLWCSRYVEGKIDLSRLTVELHRLLDSIKPGDLRLWRVVEDQCVASFRSGARLSESEFVALSSILRFLGPASLASDWGRVYCGSPEPIAARTESGDHETAMELGAVFFREVVGWNWLPVEVIGEVLRSSESLVALRSGDLPRVAASAPVVDFLENEADVHDGALAVKSLIRASRAHSLVSKVHAELDRMSRLILEGER